MSLQPELLAIFVVLISARAFAEIATRFAVPSVLGEIFAGLILGPSGLMWIEISITLQTLAEIGIILLLFDVGIKSRFNQLVHASKQSFTVATGGLVLPFILGLVCARLVFDTSWITAFFIGGTLTATSIGVTMRILEQLGIANSLTSEIVLGAAVIDDIFGVILLSLIYEYASNGQVNFVHGIEVIILIAVYIFITPPSVRLISTLIEYLEKRTKLPGLVPIAMVSLVLFFAWLAELIGVPAILGGFTVGLALSKEFPSLYRSTHNGLEFSEKIQVQLRPITQLLTPIFFVTIVLSLELKSIEWGSPFIWGFSLLFTAVAIIGKFGGSALLPIQWKHRVFIGMCMVPRGEVSLVFAQLGLTAGILTHDMYTGLIVMIAYVILLSPFWIKWFYKNHLISDPLETPAN